MGHASSTALRTSACAEQLWCCSTNSTFGSSVLRQLNAPLKTVVVGDVVIVVEPVLVGVVVAVVVAVVVVGERVGDTVGELEGDRV